MSRTFAIPDPSLVVLVGPSGAGKSTFSRQHFQPTEIVSSDALRGVVSDDINDQSSSTDAFELLHLIVKKRLARGLLTVVDATNVQVEHREPLLRLAKEFHLFAVAIVFQLSERICLEHNHLRLERQVEPHVIRHQIDAMRRSSGSWSKSGFRIVEVLESEADIRDSRVVRRPLFSDLRTERGPFDIIGDIHGCYDELCELLGRLGYAMQKGAMCHPEGRKLVFLGDLVDRGPKIVEVLELVMEAVTRGAALCVPGNHETKLLRLLRGKDVRLTHGLRETVQQLERTDQCFKEAVADFIDAMVSHYVLDDGRLVVAHAGMKEAYQGRSSGTIREFALYGEVTGETDSYGLPVRHNWATDYRGRAMVVYGHIPDIEARWFNNTICIDTGCVFGGKLTALRYPEREIVSVVAQREYFAPLRPLETSTATATLTSLETDLPDMDDLRNDPLIETELLGNIRLRSDDAGAALEVLNRFGIDPRWLIYLPPTMAPGDSSKDPLYLERPLEALSYYGRAGVTSVICEEKHMGSRAVVIVCRNAGTARSRFGIPSDTLGMCYSRTGRRFFSDVKLEQEFLERCRDALDLAGIFAQLESDWVIMDGEILPWSAKAGTLIRDQYEPVSIAGKAYSGAAMGWIELAASRGVPVESLHQTTAMRQDAIDRYDQSWRRYCRPVRGLGDLQLAVFHLLASEKAVHHDKPHEWHLELAHKLSTADSAFFTPTAYLVMDPSDEDAIQRATRWWDELTARGGEGMVVKPAQFIARNERGQLQPALKCRGREYLRMIYGAEYTLPEHLRELNKRGVSMKRSLALREFGLGMEALRRFVAREPLRRVHACIVAILTLETATVDPRL